MRTPKDIIEELKREANATQRAVLIVGFEKDAKFVWSSETDPLKSLNSLIRSGGEPLGIAVWTPTDDKQGEFSVHPLQEFEKEEWVKDYLAALSDAIRDQFTKIGAKNLNSNP